jgi:hypothetical protein
VQDPLRQVQISRDLCDCLRLFQHQADRRQKDFLVRRGLLMNLIGIGV